MKKIIITLAIISMAGALMAQPSKRTSAFNYHRYGQLDKAKTAIDEASQNEATIGDAKTWFYRGNIYYDIAISTDPKYRSLDPDPLNVAWESYKKAQQLDAKKEFKDDIDRYIPAVAEAYYNTGVLYYNGQDFKNSALSFEKAFNVNQSIGKVDTTALYNAAIAASQSDDTQMAGNYYKHALEIGFQKPDVYTSLSDIYKKIGDTTLALQTLQQGRSLFPDDFNLLIAETNIYLATNQKELAMRDLELASQKDQTNPTIFFAVGTIYDQMGDFEKAEGAYLKAIELNPNYFEANYNLGALYVNKAADIQTKANDLPLDAIKEYETEKAKADGLLGKSVPYLEKALELNPEDVNTMVSLKEIYTRLNLTEKLQMINQKLGTK